MDDDERQDVMLDQVEADIRLCEEFLARDSFSGNEDAGKFLGNESTWPDVVRVPQGKIMRERTDILFRRNVATTWAQSAAARMTDALYPHAHRSEQRLPGRSFEAARVACWNR